MMARQAQTKLGKEPFVPPPLPPSIEYGADLVRELAEANRFLGELAGLARQLPEPRLLIRPFLEREAVLSSRIEGTEADLTDLYAYQAGQAKLPGLEGTLERASVRTREADIREILNYRDALEHGIHRLDELPVSLRLMRELHERLMQGVRGENRAPGQFRRNQNWIGPEGCPREEATYVPPPPQEVEPCLGALERYVHEDAPKHPPLVRLAFIHYQFEAIHPFLDGNGRIGRLLIILLLMDWGLLPIPLLYLSAYFERHRQQYYDLLLRVTQEADWTSWLVFFLRGVSVQAGEASRLAKRLQDLQATWREKLTEPGASTSAVRLADSLFERPVLTIPQAAELLSVTYPAAKANVEKLVQTGILVQVPGVAHPKVFLAPEIMLLTEREASRSLEPRGEVQRTLASRSEA